MRLKYCIAALVVLASVCLAQGSLGDPLAGLERLKDYEAMRASSCDPDWVDGNSDRRPIEPGETLTLAELDGPGEISIQLHNRYWEKRWSGWGATPVNYE